MEIRNYQQNDLIEVAKLIQRTFSHFNKNEGSKEAVQKYINQYSTNKENLNKIKINYQKTPVFLVAIENQKIIGMIRGREDRIVNLFVNSYHQKKGIGKSLVHKFEQEVKKLGSCNIKIRSSIYATSFYQKLGYIKTTGVVISHNLKIQPMQKEI